MVQAHFAGKMKKPVHFQSLLAKTTAGALTTIADDIGYALICLTEWNLTLTVP